tara:strand:- start:1048 stop:1194 length:147 start_codon:yes stop_codon:yes gene_type:complete
MKEDSLSKGVGDTLAKIIHKSTGAKPCTGCDQRKDYLNTLFPYKRRKS